MQQTSELWKTLAAQLPNGTAWLEARAKIDNNAYTTNITAPVIARALMDNGLSVGNVVSASCTFGVRTNTDYSRGAEVVVQRRLTDGTQNSEWLTAGIFYIARRKRDYINGVTELECYDKLLRANANLPKYFPWDSSDDTNDPILQNDYGIVMEISANYDGIQADALLKNLARTLDIDLSNDAETNSISGTVHVEETATIRDALSAIAKLNGGNFIVTPGGLLKFVKLRDAYNAASAAENVCVVHGVVGSMDVYEMQEIGSVKYTTQGVEGYYPPGGPASYDLTVDIGEVENYEVAEDLWDEIDGYGYQAFTLTGAIYDPATELGDYVRAGANNEIASVLYTETATLGHSFRGDISSPVGEEITDEYPYVSTAEKVERATINYVDKKLEEIDTDFSQENIFNALTNNGAAKGLFMIGNQLYVNMTYAKTGTLVLGGVDNVNGKLEVRNANDALIGEWTNDGISVKSGTIQGPSIRLGGVNNEDGSLSVYDSTGLNLLGKWDNTGISVTKGSIDGPSITLGGSNNASGSLTVKDSNGTTIGTLNNAGMSINKGTIQGPSITLGGNNNANGTLSVKNASGTTIGTWNNSGISLTKGTIQGPSITLGGSGNSNGTLKIVDSGGSTIGEWDNDGVGIYSGDIDMDYSSKIKIGFDSTASKYAKFDSDGMEIKLESGSKILTSSQFLFGYDSSMPTNIYLGTIGAKYAPSSNTWWESTLDPCELCIEKVTSNSVTHSVTLSLEGLSISYNNSAIRFYVDLRSKSMYFSGDGNTFSLSLSNSYMTFSGSKSRMVSTDQYSDRLLYCYETPTPMFGDIGEGVIGEDGLCYIPLDSVFAQTITTDQYQVFLQKYGDGDAWVSERNGGYFIVQGTPGLKFGWELKAKQKGFDQRRLDPAEQIYTPQSHDYGADAAQHIQDIQKERDLSQ